MEPPVEIVELANLAFPYLVAAALAMARPAGMALVFPLFTRTGLVGIVRTGVVFALALPVVPLAFAELAAAGEMNGPLVVLLVLKEGLVGLLIGLAFGIPFWGAEAAGDVLDFHRGASAAYLIDPSAVSEASITGTLFVLIMLALFVVFGGVPILAEGLYRSYGIWPAAAFLPSFAPESYGLLLGFLDRIMALALVLAAPLLIAMFLSELGLALVNRFAPQMNVFDLSLALKCIVFAALLPVYAIFLVEYFKDLLPVRGDVLDGLAVFFR